MDSFVTGLLPGKPHSFLVGLMTLWVFSAAVSAMSPPSGSSRAAYRWFFRFSHLLAANLDRAGIFGEAAEELPQVDQNHPHA